MSRNLTYAAFWLYPASKTKQFAVLHLFRHAVAILLFGAQKAASLKKLLQGVVDGRRGRLGVRFLPHHGT